MTEQLDSATLRLTENEALVDLRVVLQLCAAGKLRCSEKTQRPSDATTKVITHAVGDFYDEEFAQFLESRTQVDLPGTIGTLFDDARHRASQLRDAGLVRLIACDDRAVIALIARDRKLRTLCEQVGDHHLAVQVGQEAAFRTALRKLGYVLPVQ